MYFLNLQVIEGRRTSHSTAPVLNNMLPVTKHWEIVTKTSLREAVHDVCRLQHKADSTESSYYYWMRRFYEFNGKRSLRELREPEASAFLTHIAVNEHVSFNLSEADVLEIKEIKSKAEQN